MKESEKFLLELGEYLKSTFRRDMLWAIFWAIATAKIADMHSLWCILTLFFMFFNLFPHLVPWSVYESYAASLDERDDSHNIY